MNNRIRAQVLEVLDHADDGDVASENVSRPRMPTDAHAIPGAGWTVEDVAAWQPSRTQLAGMWTMVGLGVLAGWTLLIWLFWGLASGAWRVVTRWI